MGAGKRTGKSKAAIKRKKKKQVRKVDKKRAETKARAQAVREKLKPYKNRLGKILRIWLEKHPEYQSFYEHYSGYVGDYLVKLAKGVEKLDAEEQKKFWKTFRAASIAGPVIKSTSSPAKFSAKQMMHVASSAKRAKQNVQIRAERVRKFILEEMGTARNEKGEALTTPEIKVARDRARRRSDKIDSAALKRNQRKLMERVMTGHQALKDIKKYSFAVSFTEYVKKREKPKRRKVKFLP